MAGLRGLEELGRIASLLEDTVLSELTLLEDAASKFDGV